MKVMHRVGGDSDIYSGGHRVTQTGTHGRRHRDTIRQRSNKYPSKVGTEKASTFRQINDDTNSGTECDTHSDGQYHNRQTQKSNTHTHV